MTQTALILIDIQNDYFPGGIIELENPENAANNASALLAAFRQSQQPLVHIQHENHNPNLPFMKPNTEGQRIHASVAPDAGETVIVKHYPNAFWETRLEEVLRSQGIGTVLLAGMMTHMCVSTTARAAMERGFQVLIAEDACATRSLDFKGTSIPAQEVHRTALAEVSVFAELVDSAQVVADL